jgi:hypothetical protein
MHKGQLAPSDNDHQAARRQLKTERYKSKFRNVKEHTKQLLDEPRRNAYRIDGRSLTQGNYFSPAETPAPGFIKRRPDLIRGLNVLVRLNGNQFVISLSFASF